MNFLWSFSICICFSKIEYKTTEHKWLTWQLNFIKLILYQNFISLYFVWPFPRYWAPFFPVCIIKYCSYYALSCLLVIIPKLRGECLNLLPIYESKRDNSSDYKFLILVLPSFDDINFIKSDLCLKRIQQELSRNWSRQ